ncbi:MAG: ATP-binding cassette domain-containing protein [Anaerohalosphaeraceae bacterium]|nr:ATP-binding cassette domain-containing protein [Anaerohalosphaeraceae bacterium]
MQTNQQKLLNVENLKVWFPVRRGLFRKTVGHIRAVDGVSFDIAQGKTLGLVGESGCGKTTAARSIINLIPATSGRVRFDGRNIAKAGRKELHKIRREISIIFQDPYSSLNPRMTVGSIIGEPLKVHNIASGSELTDRVESLLKRVGLSPAHINRYPHEFSGGQRQRIGIARALCLEPKLVICDEPVSALDVSIQSQIMNLLKDLQDEFGLTYLFIAHDLAVVEFVSDFVAVMYLGKIVESASAEEIYKNPLHPYTKMLLSAIPSPQPERRTKSGFVAGEIPSPSNPPSGCPFHPRCPLADAHCAAQIPSLEPKADGNNHFVACWKSSAAK